MAVHNKSVNGVRRMLARNDVPFPSIAVKKAGTNHEGFGEVSIVFPRSTIDPAEAYAPEDYLEMKKFIFSRMDPSDIEERIRMYQGKFKLSRENAESEVVANACTKMLRDSKAVTQLAWENMTLAEKIADVIDNIVQRIAAAFEDSDSLRDPHYKEARLMQKYFGEMQELWDRGLIEATENYNVSQSMKNTAPESGVHYQEWTDDNNTIGYIDFKWGYPGKGSKYKDGYGLSHIIEKRNAENGSGEKTAFKLVEVIAKATDYDLQNNGNVGEGLERIRLYYGDYTAVLVKEGNGKNWLLTGWENNKKATAFAIGEGYDSSNATAVTTTLTHHDGVDAFASADNVPQNAEESNEPFSTRDSAVVQTAVEKFGTTKDFNEAGYILPDGKMLRFTSDKKSGTRDYDHRAIAMAYGEDVDLKQSAKIWCLLFK